MFIKDFDITKIKPASYNPRYLCDEKKRSLIESITTVGFLKPIIVNSTGTIIAGHQRTKCLTEIGIRAAPAYVIDGINLTDEVRFNQLHNGSDIEIHDGDNVHVNCKECGWSFVNHKDIKIKSIGKSANYKKELIKLLIRYGEFGCSIVGSDNICIVSSDYASCCKTIKKNLLVYKSKDKDEDSLIRKYFSKEYGVFSYESLEKTTYIQSLAQQARLKGTKSKKYISELYEGVVLPNTNKRLRMLDFGAGKMAYVDLLTSKGWNIKGIEFYTLKQGTSVIDVKKANMMISAVVDDVEKNGLFDCVICDSVLNSVDSMQAHEAVIKTLRAFCKIGGAIYFSGRNYNSIKQVETAGKSVAGRSFLNFCDENLFTANLRRGNWFYQKFHTKEMVENICSNISEEYRVYGFPAGSSWRAMVKNEKALSDEEMKKAIKFEFSLPLPQGSYDRSGDVIKSLQKWR